MNWYSFASTAVTIAGIFLAYKTIRLDSKSWLNRAFALATLITAVFTFLSGLLTASSHPALIESFIYISSTLHSFYLLSSMLVLFVYSKPKPVWILIYLFVRIPYDFALIWSVWNDQWLISGYHITAWGTVLELTAEPFWIIADRFRAVFDSIFGFTLLYLAWKRSPSKRMRKIIIMISFTTISVTMLVLFLKLHVWLSLGYPDYSPVIIIFGYFIYYLVIRKYGHMTENLPDLKEKLLFTVGGIILFTNSEGVIIKTSPGAETHLETGVLTGQKIFSILPVWPNLKGQWALLGMKPDDTEVRKIEFNGIEYAARLIPQINSFGEMEGVLVQLQPLHTLHKISKRFGLSPREKEVVSLLKGGLDNRQIAERLCISYATVKNHLHNVYSKTKTENRAELIGVLLSEAEKV